MACQNIVRGEVARSDSFDGFSPWLASPGHGRLAEASTRVRRVAILLLTRTDCCRFEKGVRSELHQGRVGASECLHAYIPSFPTRPLTMDKLHGISRGSSWRRTWRSSVFVERRTTGPSWCRPKRRAFNAATPLSFCTVTPLSVRSAIQRVERDPVPLTQSLSSGRLERSTQSSRASGRARCSEGTLWERVREMSTNAGRCVADRRCRTPSSTQSNQARSSQPASRSAGVVCASSLGKPLARMVTDCL